MLEALDHCGQSYLLLEHDASLMMFPACLWASLWAPHPALHGLLVPHHGLGQVEVGERK